jgi:hypothetical protein
LCSQSTISRLENLPDRRALLRLGRALIEQYCTSFRQMPKRIVSSGYVLHSAEGPLPAIRESSPGRERKPRAGEGLLLGGLRRLVLGHPLPEIGGGKSADRCRLLGVAIHPWGNNRVSRRQPALDSLVSPASAQEPAPAGAMAHLTIALYMLRRRILD